LEGSRLECDPFVGSEYLVCNLVGFGLSNHSMRSSTRYFGSWTHSCPLPLSALEPQGRAVNRLTLLTASVCSTISDAKDSTELIRCSPGP
jgi:hypothetical protein